MSDIYEGVVSVLVHWTESHQQQSENVEMTPREFELLLSRIRRDEDRPGTIGYVKVATTLRFKDGVTWQTRFDVTKDVRDARISEHVRGIRAWMAKREAERKAQ